MNRAKPVACCRCGGTLHRCPHGGCWCNGYHHDRDGLTLCPNGRTTATSRLDYDLDDIGPGYEVRRELADTMGLDPWTVAT